MSLRTLVLVINLLLCSHAATIRLGGLFPLTGPNQVAGQQRFSGAKLAVADVNADDTLFPNVTLELLVNDTASTGWQGVKAAVYLRSRGVVGFVGSSSSSVCISVQNYLEALTPPVPQLSYSCTSETLTSTEYYPTFMRVVAPDNLQGAALAGVISSFGWPTIAAISSNDVFGVSGIDSLELAAPTVSPTFSLALRTTFEAGGADRDQIQRGLASIRAEGHRIIVVNALVTDVAIVLEEAANAGMMTGNYAFIATNTQVGVDTGLEGVLPGLLGILQDGGEGTAAFNTFSTRWAALNPTEYPGAGTSSFNSFTPFAYDAVMLYARALQAMIDDGADYTNGPLLASYVRSQSFVGVTGPLSLEATGDRRGAYRLVNYRTGSGFVTVGQWTSTGGYVASDLPVWFDGTTTVPPGDPFIVCRAGFYKLVNNVTLEATCQQCNPGTYQPLDDTEVTACLPCEPGTYATQSGQSVCNACEPGSFASEQGQTVCTGCGAAEYQPLSNQTSCLACPENSARVVGGGDTALTDCKCNRLYYGPDGGPCIRCDDESMYCPGNTRYPIAAPGYWRPNETDVVFFRCRPAERCLGGADDAEGCAEGHEGRMCATCEDDYFMSNGLCSGCSGAAFWSFVRLFFIVLLVMAIGLIFFYLAGSDLKSLEGKALSEREMAYLEELYFAINRSNRGAVSVHEVCEVGEMMKDEEAKEQLEEIARADNDEAITLEEFLKYTSMVFRKGDIPVDTEPSDLIANFHLGLDDDEEEQEGKEVNAGMQGTGKAGKGAKNAQQSGQKTTGSMARSGGGGGIIAPSISITALQILAAFDSFKIQYPGSVSGFLNILSIFNLNVEVAQPECSFNVDYYTKYRFYVFAPLLVAGYCLVVYGVLCGRVATNKKETNPEVKKLAYQRYKITAVVVFVQLNQLLYIFFAQGTMSLFPCTKQPDDTYSLDANPAEDCFTSAWWINAAFGVFSTIVVIVGFPLLFFLFLVVVRESAILDRKPTMGEILQSIKRIVMRKKDTRETDTDIKKNPYAFSFIKKYEDGWFFWEVLALVRKLLIVGISLFFATRPQLQAALALGVMFVAIILLTNARPYQEPEHDFLEMTLLIVSFIVLFGGIVFSSETATGQDKITRSIVEAIMLIALIFGTIVIFVVLAKEIKEKVTDLRREAKEAEEEDLLFQKEQEERRNRRDTISQGQQERKEAQEKEHEDKENEDKDGKDKDDKDKEEGTELQPTGSVAEPAKPNDADSASLV